MKPSLSVLFCCMYLLINPVPKPLYAETLMSLYHTALGHFPSLEAYKHKEQSLRNEYTGLGWQRLLDVDVATNYYHFSTIELGRYTSGDISVLNNFDVFNKKGVDRAIINYEIQKNKSLTDVEKKNIFTSVTEAYFNLLKNNSLLKIHEESLEWIEKNILLVNTGVENGIFPASDINRWTIEKLNRQNSIQSDKLEIARAEETLKMLTGLASVNPEWIDQTGYEDMSEESILEHSPELTVFDLEKKQMEQEIRKENWNRLPDLQVGNSLVRNREPESTGDQYLVSASLSFKFLDGGRRYRIVSDRARMESIDSEHNAARAILTELYRNKLQEIKVQKEMLKNLEAARALSSENLKNLVAGYQKRFVDFTTLFNAFREDVTLQEDYENTTVEFNINYQILYHLSCGDIFY